MTCIPCEKNQVACELAQLLEIIVGLIFCDEYELFSGKINFNNILG